MREISAEPPNKRKSNSGSTQTAKKPKGGEGTDADRSVDSDNIPQRKPRARIVVPKRSLLPSRSSRNLHPGIINMPNSRCTSEEVTAAAARKDRMNAQLERAKQERIELLAKMLLIQDRAAEAEEAGTVRSLQNVVDSEASFSPAKMVDDDQPEEPIRSSNGTDNEDKETDDDGRNDLGDAKDKRVSKW